MASKSDDYIYDVENLSALMASMDTDSTANKFKSSIQSPADFHPPFDLSFF